MFTGLSMWKIYRNFSEPKKTKNGTNTSAKICVILINCKKNVPTLEETRRFKQLEICDNLRKIR